MSNSQGDARRPYVRSMDGWWRKNPFFVKYMMREVTAFVVAAYAIMLLVGLLSLARGEAAYNTWLEVQTHPISLILHFLGLVGLVYHTWTWFEIMPKTMPPMYSNGKRVEGSVITTVGVVVAVIVTVAILLLAWSVKP